MCGLYGYISSTPNPQYGNAVRMLGVMMESRGNEATGFCTVTDNRKKIHKDSVNATTFYKDRQINPNAWMVLGHTRQKTKGANTKENAHPFMYGNVIGCHNGILMNDEEIGKFNVDSEAIFYLLNKHNNDAKEVFKQLRGSMALTWVYGDKLYMMRHNNPLYFLYLPNVMFWASTYDSLLSLSYVMGSKAEPYIMAEDVVFEIDKSLNVNSDKTKLQFKEWEPVKYTPSTSHNNKKDDKKPYNKGNNNYSRYGYRWADEYGDNRGKWDDYDYGLAPNAAAVPLKDESKAIVVVQEDKRTLDQLAEEQEYEKKIEYAEENGRMLATQKGCLFCKHLIGTYTTFYFNINTKNAYHIGCYKNKMHNVPYQDIIMIE